MLDPNTTTDLSSLSKAELEALQRQVQEALSKTEARRKKDAVKAVEQAVKEFGFSLQDLSTFVSEPSQKRSSGRTDGTATKFRNPENSNETWSGRGRRPFWFKAHLETGRSEDDLRV